MFCESAKWIIPSGESLLVEPHAGGDQPPRGSMRLWNSDTAWVAVGHPSAALGASVSLVGEVSDTTDGSARSYACNLILPDTTVVQNFLKALSAAIYQTDELSDLIDEQWQIGPRWHGGTVDIPEGAQWAEIGGGIQTFHQRPTLAPGQSVLKLSDEIEAVPGGSTAGDGGWVSVLIRGAQWTEGDGQDLSLDSVNLVIKDGQKLLCQILRQCKQTYLFEYFEESNPPVSRRTHWMLENGMYLTVMAGDRSNRPVPVDAARIWFETIDEVTVDGEYLNLAYQVKVEQHPASKFLDCWQLRRFPPIGDAIIELRLDNQSAREFVAWHAYAAKGHDAGVLSEYDWVNKDPVINQSLMKLVEATNWHVGPGRFAHLPRHVFSPSDWSIKKLVQVEDREQFGRGWLSLEGHHHDDISRPINVIFGGLEHAKIVLAAFGQDHISKEFDFR